MKYIPIIGLEVHVELKTKSKMFCGCSADYFGKEPNTHTCPVCLGLPGALPVPNKTAIDWCIKIGLALNCEIQEFSKFDRKNYFYPDLAKGYQISQYDQPFAINGHVKLSNEKEIRIRRVHMEEDTGKLTHAGNSTLIDFNRSGVPLVEIVTEPDFESASEVVEYLKKLQHIVRYLDVSNADMEKGDMRLEPNISLRKETEQGLPPYKVEVKNINSFRFVEKAINFELKRQEELLEKNETPAQETRGFNEGKQNTVSQRVKEEANDYRYFPEPDIPPIRFTKDQIENLKSQIGELPNEKLKRFVEKFNLSEYDAEILTRVKETAEFFEQTIKEGADPKQLANYVLNKKPQLEGLTPKILAEAVKNAYQKVTLDDSLLQKVIDEMLTNNAGLVEQYKNGKVQVFGPLFGQVKQKLPKDADPIQIKSALEKTLTS